MNKSDFINAMSDMTNLPKTNVSAFLDAFQETVIKTVANGDKIALVGFGTFSSNERSARTGRNPQTGEAMEFAAKTVPKFKPGLKFKEEVNK